ncbi:MAG: hypothetical protein ABIU63_16280 [Chitinophagaceae bacterium]
MKCWKNQLELSRSPRETLAAVQQLKASLQNVETSIKYRSEISPTIDSKTTQQAVQNGMAEIELLLQVYTS